MFEATWTRLLLAAACLLATTTACVVGDVGVEESDVWECTTDDDCLDDLVCIVGADGRGLCQNSVPVIPCPDQDGDGFNAPLNGDPSTCPADTVIDCDDANGAVNPGAMEMCNNADDNCDGQVDENVAPAPCALTEGVCAGVMSECVDGARVDCAANCPGPDCAYGASFGTEGPDLCSDMLDNDCDGFADDDAECPSCTPGASCGTGCLPPVSGAECGCQMGTQQCNPDGSVGDCVDANGMPVGIIGVNPEICGNGIDDNCTGQIDEPGCQNP